MFTVMIREVRGLEGSMFALWEKHHSGLFYRRFLSSSFFFFFFFFPLWRFPRL